MGNLVSRFEKAIQKVNLLYGLVIPVIIGFLLGRTISFVDSDFFRTGQMASLMYLILLVLGISALFVHLKTQGKISQFMLVALYIFYHVALALLIIFIDPYPTPFFFQFTLLLIAVDLLFGSRWQKLDIVFVTAVFYVSYFVSDKPVNIEGVLVAAVYVIGAASVAILVSKYRRISDDERKQLASATTQNTFERQRLLSLINNMGDAVLATDEKGKIMLYNAAVLNLFDTNQSLDGVSVSKLLNLVDKSNKKADIFTSIKKSTTGLTSSDYKHCFSKDDSINLYINASSIKLGFKEHTQSGYIFIMRDITKEKSLEEERDEFISVVSHELRTPVTIAEGNLSNAMFVSKQHHDPKFVIESLNQAHDQVVFLAGMINDLATLSRAERTDKPMDIVEIDPAKLLASLQNDYSSEAEVKKLKFISTSAHDVKPIITSELYLHEILQNFITNAIKYTKEGSVIVHARSDKDGNAIFSVADTGIGLSKADQKKVYEKFFRSEDYRTRESSGTGLGLYVTQKLAHRINAVITLESELNKGSTFTITVPNLKKSRKD